MGHRRYVVQGIAVLLFIVLPVAQASANTPPVAQFEVRAAPDGSATTVVLDASASRDADGTIASYQWIFGDGYSGSGVTKTHSYPSQAMYTVTLLVTDNGGARTLLSRQIDLSEPLAAAADEPVTTTPVVVSNAPVGTRVGNRAPAFTLLDLEGQSVSLSDFLGQVVLLEFWTSTCPSCVAVTPYLEQLRLQYEESGLVIVGIILTVQSHDAVEFLESHGYTGFIELLESDPVNRPTKTLYGIQRVPHAFLIDRTGVIRYTGNPGLLTADLIEPWL